MKYFNWIPTDEDFSASPAHPLPKRVPGKNEGRYINIFRGRGKIRFLYQLFYN